MENEIIQSLLAEKTKLEQEFSELDAQARNIEIGKERIRGAYIVIVDQLKKFGVIKDEATTSSTSETETPKEEVKQKTTKKSTEKKTWAVSMMKNSCMSQNWIMLSFMAMKMKRNC